MKIILRFLGVLLAAGLLLFFVPMSAFSEEASGGNTASDPVTIGAEYLTMKGTMLDTLNKDRLKADYPGHDANNPLYIAVEIPSDTETIDANALRGDTTWRIVSIDFSAATKLTKLGSQMCMGNTYLTGVLKLPESVTHIDKSAFYGCTGLTGVILPSGLEILGNQGTASDPLQGSVFYNCSDLQFIRTAGGDDTKAFELPETLKLIGQRSFYGCTGFPENTAVTIPASVTQIGAEAFANASPITTIFVETENAENYDSSAFKGDDYGIGNRLTVFKNAAAKATFTPSGFTAYKNSITYEFTLHYGDVAEKKLYGQTVDVCKGADGRWFRDTDYILPEVEVDEAPVGYTGGGWIYNGKSLTTTTVLTPDGDELSLDTDLVLQNPTIEFLVNGEVIQTADTYPHLNLSNTGATIGVKATHPLDYYNGGIKDEYGGYVEFRYQWIDVWNGGHEGPRKSEPEFQIPTMMKPGSPQIEINGAEHERTITNNYSGEDYGDGYYEVLVYGYYYPQGQPAKLFYRSACTAISSDPDRTVDTAYMFDIITSDPAEAPEASVQDISVEYGYTDASLEVDFTEQDGYTYAYQWYEADREGQTEGGRRIDGADERVYSIEGGKNIGRYYYYVEVSARKLDNGHVSTSVLSGKLSVDPKTIVVVPDSNQVKYTGQTDPKLSYTLLGAVNPPALTGKLVREAGETAGAYAIGLGTLAVSDPHYVLKLSDQPIMFTIRPYRAEATFSPETANGNSGWYCTDVIITPPTGHSISVDGGQTWVSGSITLNENTGLFDYLLRSDQEDATKNAIANNSIQLNIDKISPVFTGIADRQDYCLSANFQVTEAHLKEVAVDGRAILPEEGVYFLKPGIHTVTATDLAGNTTIVTVSVHEKHTFSELSTNAEHHWYDCVMCGETVKEEAHSLKWVIIREATSTEPGLKQNRCTVCGYVQSTDEIPANRPTTPSIPPETTEPEDELPAPDDSETEPEKPEESISPETGDGSNLKWPVLLLICAGGFLGITFILQRQNCE